MAQSIASDLAARASQDVEWIPGISDTVAKNADLLGRIIPIRPYQPGEYVRITAITSAHTAEYYVENQTLPSRSKATETVTKFAFRAYRVVIGTTGHYDRRMGINGSGLKPGQGGMDLQIQLAIQSLVDKQTTDFLARQTYGVQGIVDDSTTNWGDISRSTYDTTVSYLLNASSAALSTSLLNKANNRSQEFPYDADVQAWIAAPLQIGAYAELLSGKAAFPTVQGADVIPNSTGGIQRLGGFTFARMRDLTTSVIIGMTNLDTDWGYTPNEVAPGGFRLRPMGPADDSDTLQISTSGAIWCTSPQKQVKIYGLSVG